MLSPELLYLVMNQDSFGQYYADPDKWRTNNEHGMTKEETEERFKSIVNAYNHLMLSTEEHFKSIVR
jgi:hypothetical protein